MGYVVLYLIMMFIGYVLGDRLRKKDKCLDFINNIMLFCVSLLVFVMGTKMGSNEEVIHNLGTIGFQAVIITVILWITGFLAIIVARKVLGMNKFALTKKQQLEAEHLDAAVSKGQDDEEDSHGDLMTKLIIIFVAIGLAFGYFVIRTQVGDMEAFNTLTGHIMTVGLCLLLFSVGLDMGLAGTVLSYLKQAGFRVLVFPFVIILGTTIGGILISMIFGNLSLAESLAISYGFGWYTFAPISIANAGYVMASAVSFLHNVIRELGGIILIPILAKRLGYIEAASLPGVAAMDVCLPIVEKATRQDIIVYSMLIGFTEGVLVPVLVSTALTLG